MSKLNVARYFIKKRLFGTFRTRDQLECYQKRCLKKQLAFIRKHSAYYGALMDSDTPLSALPIMDKSSMMENFDRLNTVGVMRDEAFDIAVDGEKTRDFSRKFRNITVGLSSGTSGNRGMFIVSQHEQDGWAGMMLAKMLPREHLLGHRIAFFLRANSNLYRAVESRAVELRYFDTFIPITDHIAELNKYQPTVIISPPSALLLLAKSENEGKLHISPEKVISAAEVLEERDAEYIRAAFAQKVVHQIYQCTEGFLGCTCQYGNLHLNEDMVYIEKQYLDENRFVPVVTDFKRRSQPIIRYRLNDILIEEKEKCPCGQPLLRIKKIEGREDDIFVFEAADGGKVTVFSDFIRRCMLFSNIKCEYRVLQHRDYIEILLGDQIVNESGRANITHEFETLAAELNFILPGLRFGVYTPDCKRKLKRVERVKD